MTQSDKPLRADAARNRDRVLAAAYQAFAAVGPAVPIDEIARRAGVGPGTVYRHFPTKEALLRAVVDDRVRAVLDEGRTLLTTAAPDGALLTFLASIVLRWGGADRALTGALGSRATAGDPAAQELEREFLTVLGELLRAGQNCGAVRADVGVGEVKAVLTACLAVPAQYPDAAERVVAIVLDGLRAR